MSRASPFAVVSFAALLVIPLVCTSCAPATQAPQASPPPPPRTMLVSSRPMGLVGLLVLNGSYSLPRAAGMPGTIMGYVASHPALGSGLTVRRDGRNLPVLAFRCAFRFVQANGFGGLEDFHARGTLVVYYKADGFTNEVISGAGSTSGGDEIERDEVDLRGSVDFDTYLVHLSLDETAVATRAFTFRGFTLKPPAHRTARDVLEGEFNQDYLGIVIASAGTMPWMSAPQKLLALSGTPPPTGPFTF